MFRQSSCEEKTYSAAINRINTMQKIRKEIFQGHAELLSAFKNFESAKKEYERANNEIVLKRKEFEVGLISNIDVQQAETAWLNAQYDYLTSKIAVGKKYRTLLYSCGYPDNIQHRATI
jgi:outer membrane protein TolC